MPIEPTRGIRILPQNSREVFFRINGGTNTSALNNIRNEHANEDVINGRNSGFEIGFSQDVVSIDRGRLSLVAGIGLHAGYEQQKGLVKIGEHQELVVIDHTPPHHHDYDDSYYHHDPHYYEVREVTVNDYKQYTKGQARLAPEVTAGVRYQLDSSGDYVVDVRGLANANVLAMGEVNVGAKVGVTIANLYTPYIGYEKQVAGGEGQRWFGGVGIRF